MARPLLSRAERLRNVTVRPESPEDFDRIHAVHARAFEREAEADLVRALRAQAQPFVGLVAQDERGEVIGHVAFSPVTVRGAEVDRLSMGLAPLAVDPPFQRCGAGAALTRAGLDACRALGAARVFVLGHPEYYPRFGFEPAAARGFHYGSFDFDRAFFVLTFPSAAVERVAQGWVEYAPAFDALT